MISCVTVGKSKDPTNAGDLWHNCHQTMAQMKKQQETISLRGERLERSKWSQWDQLPINQAVFHQG